MWIDLETTGLDSERNGIIQMSYFIEIDKKVVTSRNFDIQVFESDEVDAKALEINGKTMEQINSYEPPEFVFAKIMKNLNSFIDRYDKDDKLYIAGYNVDFDLKFLKKFFEKNGSSFFGSYFNYRKLDVIRIVDFLEIEGKIPKLISHKLKDVCDHFGIKIEAHDAVNDIMATKQLYDKIREIK